MNSTSLKKDSYPILADIAKAIGHPHRLELLELVAQGPKSVDTLAKEARMSVTLLLSITPLLMIQFQYF